MRKGKSFPDVVTVDFIVFGSFPKNWVGCNLNGTNVVNMERSGTMLWKTMLIKNLLEPNNLRTSRTLNGI